MQKDLKSSLQQRHLEWIDIVNRGDAVAYAKLLSVDAVWIPPEGDPIAGREAFRKWVDPFFNQFDYKFSVNDERIKIMGDRALEKGKFVSEMTPRKGGKPRVHTGSFVILWHRNESEVWQIERYVDDTGL